MNVTQRSQNDPKTRLIVRYSEFDDRFGGVLFCFWKLVVSSGHAQVLNFLQREIVILKKWTRNHTTSWSPISKPEYFRKSAQNKSTLTFPHLTIRMYSNMSMVNTNVCIAGSVHLNRQRVGSLTRLQVKHAGLTSYCAERTDKLVSGANKPRTVISAILPISDSDALLEYHTTLSFWSTGRTGLVIVLVV